jgi:membrane protease YdiL (CAAX protease family)
MGAFIAPLTVWQALYAFLMGILYGWLQWRFRSLWYPIIAHVACHQFLVLISALGDMPLPISPWLWMAASAFMAAAFIHWIWHSPAHPHAVAK